MDFYIIEEYFHDDEDYHNSDDYNSSDIINKGFKDLEAAKRHAFDLMIEEYKKITDNEEENEPDLFLNEGAEGFKVEWEEKIPFRIENNKEIPDPENIYWESNSIYDESCITYYIHLIIVD